MSTRIFVWIVLVLLVLWVLTASTSECFESVAEEETIFISCASFRDVECRDTVLEAFKKAHNPGRIFIGICQQNKCEQETCTNFPADFMYTQNVRSKLMSYSDAKGPTLARYICSTLYKGEDWYFQIDSHTQFAPGWDKKLIEMANATAAEHGLNLSKVVLSNYPADRANTSTLGVPVLCRSKFNDDGLISFDSVIEPVPHTGVGKRVPFVSGGMLFARGSMLKEIPFDPDLPDLFQGEEILYSARLYTHGYDVFTPTKNVIFHHYIRKDSPKFWQNRPDFKKTQRQSIARVKMLLKLDGSLPLHGAVDPLEPENSEGCTRTLAEYWRFCGIDPQAKTSRSESLFCGK